MIKLLKITLKLTLEEIYNGTQKTVRINRHMRNGDSPTTCSKCKGRGEIRMVQRSILGQIINVQPCRSCNGTGYLGGTETTTTTIEVLWILKIYN